MASSAKKRMVIIDGNSLTLEQARAIAEGAEVKLDATVKKKVDASRQFVKKIAKCATPIYGINTGFGYFANKRISDSKLQQLQLNLLKSHATGHGTPLSIRETRLAMALRLNVLIKGFTGVRFKLCEALHNLIKNEIYPVIPEYGSVGASGDLAPLAHLALPLTGHGLVHFHGKIIPAEEALKSAGLKALHLVEKEGLGLINGTQIMLSVGGLALAEAGKILTLADRIAALSFEGLRGSPDALDPLIHEARRQSGQIESARNILKELQGSYLFDPKTKRLRIQDSYSLRCAPQIHGPSRDAIQYSCRIIEKELNAATDNPLVFCEEGKILSGGNFHGQALALAFDIAAMAIAEIGSVSERRLELLLNPHISGLPAFLTPNEGINSGYMALQYLSASLVNENKLLANPACTDSIPGNVGIEDHVSMGMTSARKLKRIITNTKAVLSIEMLASTQAIDLQSNMRLGKGTKKIYSAIRSMIPLLTEDRIIAEDVEKAIKIFEKL